MLLILAINAKYMFGELCLKVSCNVLINIFPKKLNANFWHINNSFNYGTFLTFKICTFTKLSIHENVSYNAVREEYDMFGELCLQSRLQRFYQYFSKTG